MTPAPDTDLFVHLAIDGRVSPTLGLKFRWPRVPSAGEVVHVRGVLLHVEALRLEADGRWVLWLRNVPPGGTP